VFLPLIYGFLVFCFRHYNFIDYKKNRKKDCSANVAAGLILILSILTQPSAAQIQREVLTEGSGGTENTNPCGTEYPQGLEKDGGDGGT
jgi:hypothetical protein